MPSDPDVGTVAAYVERKKAKGTYGKLKAHKWKGRAIQTGICPCPDCEHTGAPMIYCDADYADCKCCNETCS